MKGFLFQIKIKVRRWGAELSSPVLSAEPVRAGKKDNGENKRVQRGA